MICSDSRPQCTMFAISEKVHCTCEGNIYSSCTAALFNTFNKSTAVAVKQG